MRRAHRLSTGSTCPLSLIWPDVPKCLGVLLLSTLSTMSIGCIDIPAKYQYGPKPISDKPVTLAESQDRAAGIGQRAALKETIAPSQTDTMPVSTLFLGDIESAIQEASHESDRNKIFVLLTDGKCADCLRWEKLLLAPGVVKEKEKRGWIYVKADITWQKKTLERFKVQREDLPVGIVLSDIGNENYRFLQAPSSEAVMAQWLIDRA